MQANKIQTSCPNCGAKKFVYKRTEKNFIQFSHAGKVIEHQKEWDGLINQVFCAVCGEEVPEEIWCMWDIPQYQEWAI